MMLDGERNDGKLSRSVWSRGKAGDDFKGLPIANEYSIRSCSCGGAFCIKEAALI
jgi:hypothetical protein